MIDYIELETYIEDLLNKSKKIFRVFHFMQYLDRNFNENEEEFYPVLMTSPTGTYRPVFNALILDTTFVLNFLFPVNKKDEIIVEVNKLCKELIGKTVKFVDYKAAFNTDIPQISTLDNAQVQTINSTDKRLQLKDDFYGLVELRVHMSASNYGLFGNDVKYEISEDGTTYETLKKIEGAFTNFKETKGFESINKTQIESVANSNNVTDSITIYFDINSEIQKNILSDSDNGVNENKVYKLKKTYFEGFSTTKDIIIKQAVFTPVIGDLSTLNLIFVVAADVIK